MNDDLIKRLRAYNPPDRTVDEQRQISVDIHEAADALEAAQQRIAELEQELSRWKFGRSSLVKPHALEKARLAGLREALEAVRKCNYEHPDYHDLDPDEAIQALIDAAG